MFLLVPEHSGDRVVGFSQPQLAITPAPIPAAAVTFGAPAAAAAGVTAPTVSTVSAVSTVSIVSTVSTVSTVSLFQPTLTAKYSMPLQRRARVSHPIRKPTTRAFCPPPSDHPHLSLRDRKTRLKFGLILSALFRLFRLFRLF